MKNIINIPDDQMDIIEDDDTATEDIILNGVIFEPIKYQIEDVFQGEIRGHLLYQNMDDHSIWGIEYTEENNVIYFMRPRLIRMRPKKVTHYIQA